MKKKIYKELVAIRKELQAIRKALESDVGHEYAMVRKPYSSRYELVKAGKERREDSMEWRRFALTTANKAEKESLERVIREHNLSRQELAIILFGLRVRPGFGKKDFGI